MTTHQAFPAHTAGKTTTQTFPTQFIAMMIAAILATVAVLVPADKADATTTPLTGSAPVVAYEWRNITTTPLTVFTAEFPTLTTTGTTHIAVDITQVRTIATIRNLAERSTATNAFTNTLTHYIDAAHTAGFTVEGVAGDPSWVGSPGNAAVTAVWNFVTNYNTTHPNTPLAGLHYDIEPWTTARWTTRTATNLTAQWLSTVATARTLQSRTGNTLPLTILVPFWYDGTGTPTTVSWGKKKTTPITHLLNILHTPEVRNTIAVMAYRNTTEGANGTLALTSREFASATATPNVGIRIGMETTPVEPSTITFHNTSLATMHTAMSTLTSTYHTSPNFHGYTINDVSGVISLP